MALHTDLPIYKHAYELLRLSVDAMANMRRDFKHSLGARIHTECIDMLVLLAKANAAADADKPARYALVLERVDTVQFLLRVCNDMHLITPKVWANAIELLQSVGSQGGGLKRYFERKDNKKAPAA